MIRLCWLQALRGFCAFVVLFFHIGTVAVPLLGGPDPYFWMAWGHAGVGLFFVISGFIIPYVHWEDLRHQRGWGRYLLKRFRRIYPPYWVATGGVLAGSLLIPGVASADKLQPGPLAESFSLLPLGFLDGLPLIPVAWSLFHEIKFYLFFALLIPLNRWGRLGWICIAVLGSIAYLIFPGALPGDLCAFLFSPFNFYFLAGVVVAVWVKTQVEGRGKLEAGGEQKTEVRDRRAGFGRGWHFWLLALPFGGMAFLDQMDLIPLLLQEAGYVVAGGLLLVGVVLSDLRSANKPPRWLIRVGDASYATYLVHLPVYELSCVLFLKLGIQNDTAAFLLLLTLPFLAQAAGLIYFRLVEKPLLGLIRPFRS